MHLDIREFYMSSGTPEIGATGRFASPRVWIWRGTVRSQWESLGFDSGTFHLFTSMKGARTRLNLLSALSKPKDRLQLAKELDLDWGAVDYHVDLLNKHGLVHEDSTYGRVRMYRVTPFGESLLSLLGEFEA